MALLKRGRTKRLVLDIGSSAVRLCELSPTKSGYQLTKYLQREFGLDPAMEDEEKRERRREVIEALVKESKVRSKKAVVAVPGQSVFTRNRPLPPVPEHKVTQIVRYEIQQQIPFSLDQIALDYQVLDRTEAGGYEVMMAAIKVDVVEKQIETLNDIKRTIDIVDVSPLAAYNWLRHTGEFGEEGHCVALIDLGATTTDIVIQKDNQFKFTRSLHVGGNDITAAIASGFNMPYLEAEKLKREKGFAPTGDPKRDGKGGEVIGRVLSRLVGEINRSFSYYRSQPGGGPVARVIITGGGACLRNMIPYLQRSLNIEVRIAQPLAGLAIAPAANDASEHPEQACVALGLALRCCESVTVEINLIPPIILEIAKRKEQAFYWFLSLITLYLILASIIPITVKRTELEEQEIKALQNVLAAYDAQLINDPTRQSEYVGQLQAAESDVNKFRTEVQKLDALYNNRQFYLDKLMAVWEARQASQFKGAIAISSIQTVVIGGPGNTGDAGRAALAGKPVPAAVQQAQTPRPPRPEGGSFNVGAIKQGAAGAYNIAGFPGLAAPPELQNAGTNNNPQRGRPPVPTPGARNAQLVRPLEPNGLALFGYAEELEGIQEFVTQLQASQAFIPGGVYWHESFTAKVDQTILATATRGDVGAGGSSRAGRGRESGGSDGPQLSFDSVSSSSQTQQPGAVLTGPQVWEFRIDVQWLGKPVQHPDATI